MKRSISPAVLFCGSVLAFLAWSGALAAQSARPPQATECQALVDDVVRLACYDRAFMSRSPTPDVSSVLSKWEFRTITDKMSDDLRYATWRDSNDGSGTVIVKCDKVGRNSLYVQIRTSSHLGIVGSQARSIRYRFGKNVAVKTQYTPIDKSALILKSADVKRFTDQAKQELPLTVSVQSFDYREVEVEFDMADAKTALERVSRSCRHNGETGQE